jgi:hypothetical protein
MKLKSNLIFLNNSHYYFKYFLSGAYFNTKIAIRAMRRYNPEDSHLRTHPRKNLKSYFIF